MAIAIDRTKVEVEQRAKQLPSPTGYHILCAVPNIEEMYKGIIAKSDETIRVEEQTTIVLFVVEIGPTAYMDKTRFPTGPWCKKGDFIITRAYAGTRLKIHGKEFRLINDDTVEAVVEDPRGINRAGV